jgi:hypothetical protein
MAVQDNQNNQLACLNHSSSYGSYVLNLSGLVPGNIYYINVDNLNGSSYWGSFTLCIEEIAVQWTGSVDEDWFKAANWNINSVPSSLDVVTIPSGLTHNPEITQVTPINIAGLRIKPNASLIIAEGSTLNITNDIFIESTSAGDGCLIDHGVLSIGRHTIVQRYLTADAYHYISSPLQSAGHTVFSNKLSGQINTDFYVYDETDNNPNWAYGWNYDQAIGGNLIPGKGYACYVYDTYSYQISNSTVNTNDVTIPITHSNYGTNSDGWNLVGNPYPSPISAADFITENSGLINGTVYFWNDDHSDGANYTTEDYAVWNSMGGTGTGIGNTPNGFISIGQAFFIKKSAAGTANLVFNNDMRTTDAGFYFKSENEIQADNQTIKLSFSNPDKKLYNEILLAFSPLASNEFDKQYDAEKLAGSTQIAFYSLATGSNFAIQAFRPLELEDDTAKTIPLGYMLAESGEYDIKLVERKNIPSDYKITLTDHDAKTETELTENDAYHFMAESGTIDNRFTLSIEKIKVAVDEVFTDAAKIYADHTTNRIKITLQNISGHTKVEVFSASGSVLYSNSFSGSEFEIPYDFESTSVVVRLTNDEYVFVKKLILR